jgi:hypothetical protein
MLSTENLSRLEKALNSFDRDRRLAALKELAPYVSQFAAPEADVANMHCHTFFSYNAYGHSPASLAWLARRRGIKLMGIVDFDVLDGVDEFLDACAMLGVRGSAGMETRVFLPEFATREINSPGEPGVLYHMGIGFTSSTPPAGAADILADLRAQARQRNLGLIRRVNAYLSPVVLDYERDVLPLTPKGNATERHIVLAYIQAAERTVEDPAGFWSAKLTIDRREIGE